MIRVAKEHDAASIARIYNHYIAHTDVTFEEQEVSVADMHTRIRAVQENGLPWLVLEDSDAVAGYAYAAPWRTRPAYRHSVETSIYLDPGAIGRGLGATLYADLLARLCDGNLHTAIGGIALPNAASVALHERLGFHKVAHFVEVGFKFGRWIDVGYWQVHLTGESG